MSSFKIKADSCVICSLTEKYDELKKKGQNIIVTCHQREEALTSFTVFKGSLLKTDLTKGGVYYNLISGGFM